MPPPLVLWALSDKPPNNARPETSVRHATSEEHCAKRRRESPSGKDPTVVLRYIVLLHLILRGTVLGSNAGRFRIQHPPKSLAPVTRNIKIVISRNAKKVFVSGGD